MTSTVKTSLLSIWRNTMPEQLAVAVFLATFDLPGSWWFEPLQICTRGVLCFILLSLIVIRRKPNTQFLFICVFFAWITCTTTFYQVGNLPYMFVRLSSCILIVLMLEYERRKSENLIKCLSALRICLIAVCLLDALTMVIFPTGMYTSGSYTINWFLGYKTARMVYLLPMMTLTAYLSEIKYGGMRKSDWILFIISVAQTFYSQASGAALTLLFFAALIFLRQKKEIAGCHICEILTIVAIVNAFVLTSEDNPVLQYIIQDLLHKTSTLSNRTIIWEACIERIKTHLFFGGGVLTTNQYVALSGFSLGTNAHNMALTLLVTVGIAGIVLYIMILLNAFRWKGGRSTKTDAVLYYAVIVMLIIGITSSAMIFSAYAFLPMMLAAFGKENRKIKGYGVSIPRAGKQGIKLS